MSRIESQENPLIILGVHRSGTSFLARELIRCGVFMGEDLNIHDESKAFMRLNDVILDSAHAAWDRPLGLQNLWDDSVSFVQLFERIKAEINKSAHTRQYYGTKNWVLRRRPGRWGWKDPRSTVTLPLWLKMYPSARVLFIVRNGVDVALSIHRREMNRRGAISSSVYSVRGLNLMEAFMIWREYNELYLAYRSLIPPDQLLEIRYEDLVNHPSVVASSISEFLNISNVEMFKSAHNQSVGNYLSESIASELFRQVRSDDVMIKFGYDKV